MTTFRTAAVFAIAILVAPSGDAQSTSASTVGETKVLSVEQKAPAAQGESPLVKAAKDSATKRATKSRLSITDKDVKKSAGKLIETTSKPLPPVQRDKAAEQQLLAEKAAAEQASEFEKMRAKRVAESEKKVAELEVELRRLEETYYDEDDADFREDVIEKRFNDTKAKLEKARQELEAIRNGSAAGATTP